MTWFDALLVTLLGLVTALGMRRGLAGGVWGLGAVALCWLSNLFSGPAGLVSALLLSAGLGVATKRLRPQSGHTPLWHMVLGSLGGFAFGLLVICTLALGFPVQKLAHQRTYPSADMLSRPLYLAIKDSYIQNSLQGAWVQKSALQQLLVPDQVRSKP